MDAAGAIGVGHHRVDVVGVVEACRRVGSAGLEAGDAVVVAHVQRAPVIEVIVEESAHRAVLVEGPVGELRVEPAVREADDVSIRVEAHQIVVVHVVVGDREAPVGLQHHPVELALEAQRVALGVADVVRSLVADERLAGRPSADRGDAGGHGVVEVQAVGLCVLARARLAGAKQKERTVGHRPEVLGLVGRDVDDGGLVEALRRPEKGPRRGRPRPRGSERRGRPARIERRPSVRCSRVGRSCVRVSAIGGRRTPIRRRLWRLPRS